MHIRSLSFLHDTFPTTTSYPFSLEVFNKTDRLAFPTPVTFFIGENGTGKSTLLQAIARASGIHIWEEHEGRRDATNLHEDQLHRSLRIEWTDGKVPGSFFASEIFSHFAQALDQWGRADAGCLDYFGKTSLIVKSHGQSHMAFFENRFARKGLYLLDEPENALSPTWQLELLRLLRRFSRRGDVQFIIATHSPILMAFPDAELLSFDGGKIRPVEFDQLEHVRLTRDFLQDPGAFIERL